MKIFVPALGTKIKLTNFWEFLVYPESRSESLWSCMGPHVGDLERVKVRSTAYYRTDIVEAAKFILPPKTVLGIDRVYIRKGGKDFSSITMKIHETTHPFVLANCVTAKGTYSPAKARFWVKLCDFNKIEAEIVEDATPQHKYLK